MNIILLFILISPVLLMQNSSSNKGKKMENKYELATLAGGCFWCVEAIYLQLNGVVKVESGYSGGTVKNPTYDQVCTEETGYAEVVQITFEPKIISYKELLEIFFRTHDPTTLNKQGADIGTQYRSAIFYHDESQKKMAEEVKNKSVVIWENKIVTEISKLTEFYKAEEYHQNYYNQNSNQPYCSLVINPKLKKFKKEFESKLKKDSTQRR